MIPVLAVDPGTMTGFVVVHWTDEVEIVRTGQEPFERFGDMAEQTLSAYGKDLQVCVERFVVSPGTIKLTQQTEAIEVIGALRWLCHRHGAARPVLQAPADAKRLVTDVRLKTLGWYAVGDHARDAMRHLGLWLVKAGWQGLPT